jgi:hypothetical protein
MRKIAPNIVGCKTNNHPSSNIINQVKATITETLQNRSKSKTLIDHKDVKKMLTIKKLQGKTKVIQVTRRHSTLLTH